MGSSAITSRLSETTGRSGADKCGDPTRRSIGAIALGTPGRGSGRSRGSGAVGTLRIPTLAP